MGLCCGNSQAIANIKKVLINCLSSMISTTCKVWDSFDVLKNFSFEYLDLISYI